jgi:hypothetical protein
MYNTILNFNASTPLYFYLLSAPPPVACRITDLTFIDPTVIPPAPMSQDIGPIQSGRFTVTMQGTASPYSLTGDTVTARGWAIIVNSAGTQELIRAGSFVSPISYDTFRQEKDFQCVFQIQQQ